MEWIRDDERGKESISGKEAVIEKVKGRRRRRKRSKRRCRGTRGVIVKAVDEVDDSNKLLRELSTTVGADDNTT